MFHTSWPERAVDAAVNFMFKPVELTPKGPLRLLTFLLMIPIFTVGMLFVGLPLMMLAIAYDIMYED